MAMKGEKDALLMLAHRKEANEKRIPNGPGFTVTQRSAMGNRTASGCSVTLEEKKQTLCGKKNQTN